MAVEFPKWVEPNPSRIVRDERGVSVRGFPSPHFPADQNVHVDRNTGKVTVIVENADQELSAKSELVGA